MERIGDQVGRALRGTGGDAGRALHDVLAAWPRAVGDAVARNAWPLRVGRDGTLHVATSSSTWAFELDRMSEDVLARLSAELGEAAPARVRFRPGPVPEPGPTAQPAQLPPPSGPSPEALRDADAATASIEDPELRETVRKALLASFRDRT